MGNGSIVRIIVCLSLKFGLLEGAQSINVRLGPNHPMCFIPVYDSSAYNRVFYPLSCTVYDSAVMNSCTLLMPVFCNS